MVITKTLTLQLTSFLPPYHLLITYRQAPGLPPAYSVTTKASATWRTISKSRLSAKQYVLAPSLPRRNPPQKTRSHRARRVSRPPQLVTSIREAAQVLRECANKTDSFANYLQNVFPVPQPYSALPFAHALQPAPAPAAVPDGAPVKRKPGRPKKADQDEDAAAADDGALNGDGKKRKRQVKEKKPKDPNAPKRPPSAYLLYQNQVRKEVQAANPNMAYSEILTYISRAWGQLSDKDKKVRSHACLDVH